MTLDGLRKLELSLMRRSFEIACEQAGLSTTPDSDEITADHACLASTIQILVEQGFTDATAIAQLARNALASRKDIGFRDHTADRGSH